MEEENAVQKMELEKECYFSAEIPSLNRVNSLDSLPDSLKEEEQKEQEEISIKF